MSRISDCSDIRYPSCYAALPRKLGAFGAELMVDTTALARNSLNVMWKAEVRADPWGMSDSIAELGN